MDNNSNAHPGTGSREVAADKSHPGVFVSLKQLEILLSLGKVTQEQIGDAILKGEHE